MCKVRNRLIDRAVSTLVAEVGYRDGKGPRTRNLGQTLATIGMGPVIGLQESALFIG